MFNHKRTSKVLIILVSLLLILPFIGLKPVKAENPTFSTNSYMIQRLKIDKQIVKSMLPKDVKADIKLSDDKSEVLIYFNFPEKYTHNHVVTLVKSIQTAITKSKSGFDYSGKENTDTIGSKSIFSTDYYLTGSKTFVGPSGSSIYNSINTIGHVTNYVAYKKISITGTSVAIIQNPPPNYESIKLDIRLHVWGLGLSIGFPPSGSIVHKVWNFGGSESAPRQYVMLRDWGPYICYGLNIYRFGQDQTVKLDCAGIITSYWYYLGHNVN